MGAAGCRNGEASREAGLRPPAWWSAEESPRRRARSSPPKGAARPLSPRKSILVNAREIFGNAM